MTKQTVLIIEDVPAARDVLRKAFEKCADFSFEVVPAENASQADEWLKSHKPDVVTIDLNLGKSVTDGLQWMQRQMLFQTCPNAVKIVVTGFAQPENIVQAMRLGAWDFISKGLDTFAAQTVKSAVARLKQLEEAKRVERFIFDEWLSEHEESLQKEHPGEYVAIDGEGNTLAYGQSMLALAAGLPGEWLTGEREPFILQIQERRERDQSH